MHAMKKSILGVALAAAVATGANASTTSTYSLVDPSDPVSVSNPFYGDATNGGGSITGGYLNSVSFVDKYGFSLTSPSTIGGTVEDISVSIGETAISNFSAGLYSVSGHHATLVESLVTDGNLFTVPGLTAGTKYIIEVAGTTAAGGGQYTLNYGISSVPVPGAVVLFGSGLLLVAGVARRKQKTGVA